MTPEQQKQRVIEFLATVEKADAAKLDAMVTDNFEWRVMTRMEGTQPVKGKNGLKEFAKNAKASMPNGVNFTFGTIFSEGNDVSVQAESNTITANGRKYNNLYHFYFRFEGERIAQVREYLDSNHVREVFYS